MMTTLAEKVKGFLLDPVSSFRNARDDPAGTVLRFFAVPAVVYAACSAIISAILPVTSPLYTISPAGIPLPVFVFLMTLIGVFIGALIFSAWLHVWVYILGGHRGIFQSIKTFMYGGTPVLLFGWIPVLGFLFFLWSLYLVIVGIKELQEISMARAILAVFIAVMVPLILLVIIASYLIIAYGTASAVPVS